MGGCKLAVVVLIAGSFGAIGCKKDTAGSSSLRGTAHTYQAREPEAVCEAGCERLRACAPELPPGEGLAARVSPTCASRCGDFAAHVHADDVARRLDDCLAAPRCELFDACVETEPLSVWTRMVAPVGGGDCPALCTRVAGCERACDDCDAGTLEAQVAEREERCVVRCESEAVPSRRKGMLACAEHATCGALNDCLDESSAIGSPLEPVLGVHPACSAFCDRSIRCGAQESEVDDQALGDVQAKMTSARVECAVACMSTLDDGKATQLEACTSATDCDAFWKCADDH